MTADPAIKCYMPGVPRATYMPFPFQIVQTPEYILLAYEFASSTRVVYMNKPDFESPVDTWMGHSRGHWEGETLVVDVTSQVPDTWFDSAGNFHSEAVHVVERYTPVSPNAPHVRSQHRGSKRVHAPLEDEGCRSIADSTRTCSFWSSSAWSFVEELMYGHLRKGASQ